MKQVFVSTVGLDGQSGKALVLLNEPTQERLLPIWIGLSEASAISCALHEVKTDRPLTQHLLSTVIQDLHYNVEKVEINEVVNNAYIACVYLTPHQYVGQENEAKEICLDARPSDAIALALLNKAPIFVANSVLDRGSVPVKRIRDAQAQITLKEDLEFKDFIGTVKASDFVLKEE